MRTLALRAAGLLLALAPTGAAFTQTPPALCGGADPIPLDTRNVRGGLAAAITVADLDGDGRLEILSGDAQGYVHVWDAGGSTYKHWPKHAGVGPIFGSPSVGDIDGDGRPDVVATSHYEAAVYAWRSGGSSIRGFPQRIAFDSFDVLRGSALLVDLTGDAILEIVAATSRGAAHAFTFPFRSEAAGWPLGPGGGVQGSPASADLDQDGAPEILLNTGLVSVVRADGSPYPGWPRMYGGGGNTPVAGDLEGDGSVEIVTAATMNLNVLASNGTLRFSTRIAGDSFNGGWISLGDITRDGIAEIIATTQGGRIYAYTSMGAAVPGWPVDTGGDLASAPLIVDLNGDGSRDVLVLASDGTLRGYAVSGVPVCQPVALGALALAAPAVGDLDGDGLGEVIAATYGGSAYRLGLPGAWSASRVAWPMAQADQHHTGRLPPP